MFSLINVLSAWAAVCLLVYAGHRYLKARGQK